MANISVPFYQVSADNKNDSKQQKAGNEATKKKSSDGSRKLEHCSLREHPPSKENTEMSFSDWKKKKDAESKQFRPRNEKSLFNSTRSNAFFIGSARDVYQPLRPPPPPPIPLQLEPWNMPWQPNASMNNNGFFRTHTPIVQMNRRRDQELPRHKASFLMTAKPIASKSMNIKNLNINFTTNVKPAQSLQQTKTAQQKQQYQQKQQSVGIPMIQESGSLQNKTSDQQKPQHQQLCQGPPKHQLSPNTSKPILHGGGSKPPYKVQNKPTQWIIKPQIPTPTVGCKEEKKRLWREYRQGMKPFKNREFANAKRVIQRLGKRDIKELNEIDIGRLQRAQQHVTAHKSMLSQKAASRWVRMQDEASNKKEVSSKNMSSQPDESQVKAQIYVRKSNIYQNNNHNRGGYPAHNSGFGSSSGCYETNNSSWSGPSRQNNVNSLMGRSYGNNFVSGGHLNSQFMS